MKTQETQKERLLAYARTFNLTQNALEQSLGLSVGTLSHNKGNLSPNVIKRLKETFPNWDISQFLSCDEELLQPTNINSTKERLLHCAKLHGISKSELTRRLGLSVSAITNAGNNLSQNIIQRVEDVFPDWDIDWILNGNNNDTPKEKKTPKQTPRQQPPQQLPVSTDNKQHGQVSALYERLLSSKDETITQLKETQAAKDELISSLREQIELLKSAR